MRKTKLTISIPTYPESFTALDFEKATKKNYSICQVGFVVYENKCKILSKSILIKPPENKYDLVNSSIHNIYPEDTINAPTFDEIYEEQLFPYLNNRNVVAHKISTEISYLMDATLYYDLNYPRFREICTYKLFNRRLDELAQGYRLSHVEHNALSDAEVCGESYINFLNGIELDQSLIIPKVKDKSAFFSSKKIDKENLCPDFENADPNCHFYKKKVVITGQFDTIERNELAFKLKENGADVNTAISKFTDYVIAGKGAGPAKMKKIATLQSEGYPIKILNEEETLKLMR